MTDYKHTGGDLTIENGDLARTEAKPQHVALVLQSAKGDWKWSPLTGCNLSDYLKGRLDYSKRVAIAGRIKLQLQFHNMPAKTVEVSTQGEILIKF